MEAIARSFLALLAFDDANEYLIVHPKSSKVSPRRTLSESAGRHTLLAKVVSFGCIHCNVLKIHKTLLVHREGKGER